MDDGSPGQPLVSVDATVPSPEGRGMDTTVEDVQLGYATDTGNTSVVKSLAYNGKTYAFACPKPPVASPGPSKPGSAAGTSLNAIGSPSSAS